MTEGFFVALLFGHLFGDFLFQPKWMAMNKSGKGYTCLVHCMIYTIWVWIFTRGYFEYSWQHFAWPVLVFATHYPIDRWSLADKWLDFIKGRSLRDFLKNGHKEIPMTYWRNNVLPLGEHLIQENNEWENYRILRGGFTAVVYTVTDNTMHLVLMYYGAKLLL